MKDWTGRAIVVAARAYGQCLRCHAEIGKGSNRDPYLVAVATGDWRCEASPSGEGFHAVGMARKESK